LAVRGDPGLQQVFLGAEGDLKQELEQFARDLSTVLAGLSRGAEPRRDWLSGIARVAGNVGFGEVLRVDSTGGVTVTARLPKASTSDSGRLAGVCRLSTSGTVNVIPPGGALIDGAASLALPATIGLYLFEHDGVNFWRVRA
jgi:hypothetical protein